MSDFIPHYFNLYHHSAVCKSSNNACMYAFIVRLVVRTNLIMFARRLITARGWIALWSATINSIWSAIILHRIIRTCIKRLHHCSFYWVYHWFVLSSASCLHVNPIPSHPLSLCIIFCPVFPACSLLYFPFVVHLNSKPTFSVGGFCPLLSFLSTPTVTIWLDLYLRILCKPNYPTIYRAAFL